MTSCQTFANDAHRTYGDRNIGRLLFVSALLVVIIATPAVGQEPSSSALPDVFQAEQLLWELELGSHHYTVPRVDGRFLYIGVNDTRLDHPVLRNTGGGILMRLERATGKMIWQLPIPRFVEGNTPPMHFNHWKCGVCSRPAIDGDRLYIVGLRGDVLCLDKHGQANGNDGPFLRELQYMGVPAESDYELTETDGDIIWRFDMIRSAKVVPHDVCGSSPAVFGDYLYACTSNGVDNTHRNVVNPSAPSLIALDKRTGWLAGVDGELIGKRMFHGHWSSPVAMTSGDKTIILFGGGDGVLYAFEPLEPPTTAKPRTLKTLWKYDCCPKDYRERDGQAIPYARWNRNSPDGPSEIISTPIIHKNRIYVAIGQSPIHGPGQGMLSCIDGTTGQKVWESRKVSRTLSDVAIHDGLLYASDYSGRMNCFDADTGKHVWQQELDAGVWCCSPVVADGKVYVSTEGKMLWVLKAGRERQVLSRGRARSEAITPVYEDGVLYLPTQRRLFAVKIK
ncbi:MAG: PQQ-like beta-propeller repeat protein [Pirellulaceae bacterium]|nr:PQQ-like beta-propeller repeat protein [Pirellulaceae bacterium]